MFGGYAFRARKFLLLYELSRQKFPQCSPRKLEKLPLLADLSTEKLCTSGKITADHVPLVRPESFSG